MLSRKRCSNGRFLQPDSRAGASSKRSLLDRQNMMPYELSIGSKGEFVKNAQLRLIDLGYSCGRSGVDGQFGMDTYSAVIAFQRQNSLMPDGVIGEGTANVLYSKEAIRYSETSVLKKESVSLENFVNIALAECGIVEANDNITKYGEWYGMNGKPWCAMFVSWCANQAGLLASSENNSNGIIPKYASVYLGMEWYKDKNRFGEKGEYRPKYGDILFLKTEASHTAIVVGYDEQNNKVYSIEGNFSDKVCKVWRYADDPRITGYGINGGISNGYILEDATSDVLRNNSVI